MFHVQVSQKKSTSAGSSSYSPVSAAGSLERGQGQLGSRVHVSVGVCVTATAMCSIRQAADDAEVGSYNNPLGCTWQGQGGWHASTIVIMRSYHIGQAADDAEVCSHDDMLVGSTWQRQPMRSCVMCLYSVREAADDAGRLLDVATHDWQHMVVLHMALVEVCVCCESLFSRQAADDAGSL